VSSLSWSPIAFARGPKVRYKPKSGLPYIKTGGNALAISAIREGGAVMT